MIRYQIDFGNQYFVEYFRNSAKIQSRILPGDPNLPIAPISVVTACMNRLRDLRLTLPKNIEDNKNYPAEFIVLDYGSTDGLGKWIRSEMSEHIESNRLVYYRTEQQFFKHNHSRNVLFRLAKHDLITNVDADNFIHEGFLDSLRQCNLRKRLLIVPQSFMLQNSTLFYLRGRFAMSKQDIFDLGGFDEEMEGYSHDDVSFVLRALLSGFYTCRFEDKYLENRIETPMEDRFKMTQNHNSKEVNAKITREKLSRCVIRVNKNANWGSAELIKNFSEHVRL